MALTKEIFQEEKVLPKEEVIKRLQELKDTPSPVFSIKSITVELKITNIKS